MIFASLVVKVSLAPEQSAYYLILAISWFSVLKKNINLHFFTLIIDNFYSFGLGRQQSAVHKHESWKIDNILRILKSVDSKIVNHFDNENHTFHKRILVCAMAKVRFIHLYHDYIYLLWHNYMRGGVKDDRSCENGEDCEHNQADTVNHLCGKESKESKECKVK